jgi:hypothetical protein
MVKEFFRLGKLSKGTNISPGVLFLKIKLPFCFFEYRPISLVHGKYKIVVKLLSIRLKLVKPSVINAN